MWHVSTLLIFETRNDWVVQAILCGEELIVIDMFCDENACWRKMGLLPPLFDLHMILNIIRLNEFFI